MGHIVLSLPRVGHLGLDRSGTAPKEWTETFLTLTLDLCMSHDGVVVIFLNCVLNRFPIFICKVLNSKPYLVYSLSNTLQDAIIYIARGFLVIEKSNIFFS